MRPFWKLCLVFTFLFSTGLFNTGTVALAEDSQCPPVPIERVSRQLETAREQIQLVDYPAALTELEKVEQMLPCATEAVPPQLLSRFQFLRGLTMFYLGNEQGARNAFMRALSFDQSLKWDTQFGQRPRETFLDAREQSLSRPTNAIKCPPLASGVKVYVDGKLVASGESLSLATGTHFQQIHWPSGRWEGTFFDLTPGREELALPRQALAQGDGPRTSGNTGTQTRPPRVDLEPSTGRSMGKIPFYLSSGVAVAGAASAITFGVIYNQTATKIRENYDQGDLDEQGNPKSDDLKALYQTHVTSAYAADASLVLTALGAGGAVFFLLTGNDDEHSASRSPSFAPVVVPGMVGLLVHGEF